MQHIAKANIYDIQHKLFDLLVLLLMQLIDTICASNFNCAATKPREEAEMPPLPMSQVCPAETMEGRQTKAPIAAAAKNRNKNPTDYAKVELLHRMLVAQQLQQLEQRRLVRLAIARRRLHFELSN